ncbi:hypothetical protein [Psychrobium sp. 1_MG-2023]|uniref:hypothetical protein n=1 Tax=Psychrobium sp. 1_MG-2023 TaxID=3062624 RepID=UPI000C32691F|nr:hypothetical protein [Psychrobium sp. 1_MG-2023]MDP2561418.1 hypothetical protein [Psychrobium sp. 1_MG-2023]PKF54898.1 hypothetical protein CW748_15235 [Alteromonadales bacterium alter-6D02]
MKWTNGKKEQLFVIAKVHDKKLVALKEVNESSEVIHCIAEQVDEEPRAVLFMLAKMGFFKANNRTSYRDGVFYKRDANVSIEQFSIHPQFEKLSTERATQLELALTELIKISSPLQDCLSLLSKQFEISELNVKYELVRAGLLVHDGAKGYQFSDRTYLQEDEPIAVSVGKLQPENKLKDAVNKYRAHASQLYNVTNHNRPCLIQSNDGTGFGKSYGVISEYIDYSTKPNFYGQFTNLVFVSPQKSQFDFDSGLVSKAHNAGIEFVAFLSMLDLTDLEFESWVSSPNGEKIKNSVLYTTWIKKKTKYKSLEKGLTRLAQSVRTVESLQNRINTEVKTYEADNAELISDLKKQLEEQRRNMEKTLFDLSLACLNYNSEPVDLEALFESNTELDMLRTAIIKHCIPFSVAMVKPCIMLATTNKFDLNIRLPQKNPQGLFSFKSMPFDCIVGGKKHLTDSNIRTGIHLSDKHEKRVEFLKEDFFEADDSNYFRDKGIGFTVVIDELHDAHKLFSDSATTTLITPDIQLAHVFAGVYRIYMQATETVESDIEYTPFYADKLAFIEKIKDNLSKYCELSAGLNLKSVLTTFAGNIDFVQIRHGDAEQIINLTRNAFCFTPKRYFNEDGLKRIKVRLAHGTGTCQLYYTTDESDNTLSLHDVYQVTMAVLAAAAKEFKSSSEFVKSLKQGGDSSQNYPLYKFMKKARTVASEVESMFDRPDESEEIQIDHFYTYFHPKTVFSLIPQKLLEFREPSLEKLTYVNFSLSLIKEQPEVSILRMLHNTQNSVIALSATSGINKNIVGQYNQPFLRKYCCEGTNNLGVEIVVRDSNSKDTLVNLRETRAELRKVQFHVFDEKREVIDERVLTDDFKAIFELWYSRLKDYSYKQDKYKTIEFKRQLSAWLLCAYDGKHTLSLALSGNFLGALKKYVMAIRAGRAAKPKGFRELDKKGRIFQFTPFQGKPVIQTVLFNAELNKEVDVRKFVQVDSNNLKLAFMSTYKGAGTGLNYFVEYLNEPGSRFEVDFERLVLVNSPFWSQVIKDSATGEKTLYSLANCLSIMKRISDTSEDKALSEFEVNLVHGKDYRFLNYEHELELLKAIMQAIGRIERKDANMLSEIYMASDIADIAAVQFSRLSKDPKNDIFFESMSLLNHRFKTECHERSLEVGFKTESEREAFELEVKSSGELLNEFFEVTVPEIIEDARRGDDDSMEFNELLRKITSVSNPEKYIQQLQASQIAKSDKLVAAAIDKMYIRLDGNKQSLKLCYSDKSPEILTDIVNGDRLYRPEQMISLDYTSKMEFTQDNLVTTLVRESASISLGAFQKYVPHPKLIKLIKGNVGEHLFSLLLDKLNVTPLSTQEVIKRVGKRAYELFDFYVEFEGMLLCIDVKNWSSSLDKAVLSKSTHKKALSKINTISEYVSCTYDEVHYMYVNGRLENNSLNHEQEIDNSGKLYYLNLFKEESSYRPKHKRNADGETTQYFDGSQLKQRIALNRVVSTLLQGNV